MEGSNASGANHARPWLEIEPSDQLSHSYELLPPDEDYGKWTLYCRGELCDGDFDEWDHEPSVEEVEQAKESHPAERAEELGEQQDARRSMGGMGL